MDMNVFKGSDDYVVTKELMNAVNVSIALQKPLLIKGEPGTGKTMLAEAIAEALGKELIIWNIKSTTKAQDGLYVYDVVQRLKDFMCTILCRDCTIASLEREMFLISSSISSWASWERRLLLTSRWFC